MDIFIQEAVLNLQSAREQVSDISQEFKIWRLLSLETGFQSDSGHIQRGILLQNELAACRNTLQLCIKTLNLLIKKKNLDLGSSGESLFVAGVKRRQTESEIEKKAILPEPKRAKVAEEVDRIINLAPIAQKQTCAAADEVVALAAESSAHLPETEKQIARDEKDIIHNDLPEFRSMDQDDDQEEVSHEIHDDSVSVLLDSLDSNHVKEDHIVDEEMNDKGVEDPENEQDDDIVNDADVPESIQHAQNEYEPLATREELQTHEMQPSSPKEPSDDERNVEDVQLQVPTQEQPAEQERKEDTQIDAEEIAVTPTEEEEADHADVEVKATVADEEEVSKEQDIEEQVSADEEVAFDAQKQDQSVSDTEETQEQEMLNVQVEDEEMDNAASDAEVLVDSIVSEVPVADDMATNSTDEALSEDEDEEEKQEQAEAEESKENAVMTKDETDGSNPFVLATQEEQEADISDVQELNGAASESDSEPEKPVEAVPEEMKGPKREMTAPKSILKNSPVKTPAKASKSKKSRQVLKEQPDIITATSQPPSLDNLSPFSKATAHLSFPPKPPATGKKGLRSSKTFQSLSQITIERVRNSIAASAPASVPAKKVQHVQVSEDDDASDSDSDDSSSSGGDDADKIRSVKQVRKKSKRRKSMFQRLADDGMFFQNDPFLLLPC